MVVEKIASIGFMSRDLTHLAHLKVKGSGAYAAHMALGGFYDTILGQVDGLVEAAQGKFGILDIEVMDMKGDPDDPVSALKSHVAMIENLGKKCEERFLQNIVDEIIATYYSTIYKLENLK